MRSPASLLLLLLLLHVPAPATGHCAQTKAYGCFADPDGHFLSGFSFLGDDSTTMTLDICAQFCLEHKLAVAGVEYGHQVRRGERERERERGGERERERRHGQFPPAVTYSLSHPVLALFPAPPLVLLRPRAPAQGRSRGGRQLHNPVHGQHEGNLRRIVPHQRLRLLLQRDADADALTSRSKLLPRLLARLLQAGCGHAGTTHRAPHGSHDLEGQDGDDGGAGETREQEKEGDGGRRVDVGCVSV